MRQATFIHGHAIRPNDCFISGIVAIMPYRRLFWRRKYPLDLFHPMFIAFALFQGDARPPINDTGQLPRKRCHIAISRPMSAVILTSQPSPH